MWCSREAGTFRDPRGESRQTYGTALEGGRPVVRMKSGKRWWVKNGERVALLLGSPTRLPFVSGGMVGARRELAQSQQLGKALHRRPRVGVGGGIGVGTVGLRSHLGVEATNTTTRRRLGRKLRCRQRGGGMFGLVHGAAIS